MQDHYTLDGQTIPRFFVSAQTGEGLAALRNFLSHEALQGLPQATWGTDDDQNLTNAAALD